MGNTTLNDPEKIGGINSLILSPRKITGFLFTIALFLFVADLSVIMVGTVMQIKTMATWYLARYFELNGENNFPSLFSTLILFFSTVLLYVTGSGAGKERKYWIALSLIFLFICIDENIQIHEQVSNYMRAILPEDSTGFLHWAWVVPYFAFFCLTAALFLPFVLRLDRYTRLLFFISGAMFVGGAVGLELFEGYFFKLYGIDHLYNKILYSIEELLEMSGIVLFNYALLARLAVQGKSVKLLADTFSEGKIKSDLKMQEE